MGPVGSSHLPSSFQSEALLRTLPPFPASSSLSCSSS